MRKSLYAAGALVFLTLLLTPAFGVGVEWVDVGGNLDPATNPQRVTAPAPVAPGNTVTAGQVSPNQGGSPAAGMPATLEYVYIDPPLYSIWSYPWYGYVSSMRWQSLYPKSLIGRDGTIHEIAVFKDYYPSYYGGTFPNVSVKLCHTTVNNLGSSASGNYGGNTPVTVFHADELERGSGDGSFQWDSVECQTDFDYDSSYNLLVEVTWQGSASGYVYTWGSYNSSTLMAYYPGSGDTTYDYMYTSNYLINTRIGFVPPGNNTGVTKILSPADPFSAYGDTLFPACVVKNYGSEAQTGVPVRCKINEKVSGIEVYNESTSVDLAVGEVDTVYFPGYGPPAADMAYVDTCRTENPGDVKPEDDAIAMDFSVTQWGSLCKAYHNGTFDDAVSWVDHGWWATKYALPGGARINGMNYWTSSFGGADYSQHAQLYLDDAGGVPGTLVYDTAVEMKTAIWTNMYKNHYDIPAQDITGDSFFVAMDETEWSNGGQYCFLGMCFVNVQVGRDYGKYGSGSWGKFNSYGDMNFGMDYCFSSPLIDAACVDISYPPATIDSNTTFQATFAVKNVGLHTRQHVPYQFHIVNDATNDTIFKVSGDAGKVLPGQVKSFTPPESLTPLPGNYTMTGITNVLYDYQYQNDTLHLPLYVRYVDVRTEIVSPRLQEVPGLVPVMVRLINNGTGPVEVPRVDITIMPSGYTDYRQNIAIGVGASQVITFNPWVCPAGGNEIATAWITFPEDMNHGTVNDGIWNDTASRAVRTGIPGWTELTPLPAPPSGKYIKDGGAMAYDAGTDLIYASKGYKTGDFFAYDVNAGTWTNLTGIPLGAEGKPVYKGSVICSDGNGKLYLTKGNNTVGFWGYDADTNAWTQLTNVPLGGSNKKVKQGAALAWATSARVGHECVYLLKGYRNEFYRYNPVANEWRNLIDAPIGLGNRIKWDDGSWLVADEEAGNMLYAFKAKYHEFYLYDTDADTWSRAKNAMPIPGSAGNKKAKTGSSAAWYSGKIYAFKGGNTTEFWRYFPLGDTWQKQDDIPLWGMSGSRKKVKAGAALAGSPGTGVYGFKGNKSLEFWRYTPYDVVAGAQPSRDGVTAGNTGIGALSFAIAPNPLAGGFATVRYNLPKAGMATLNVFDVTGRTVLTQTMAAGRTGTASLDLRKLEAGVYLVKVTTEGFSTTQKLVVEH